MRPLKKFQEFLEEETVKKQFPDKQRAKDLIDDSNKGYKSLMEFINKIGLTDTNANTMLKESYDVIMGLIRAKMLIMGFSAIGAGAHEAEVSYLRELKFPESDIEFLNQLRYFRNGIMYYGKRFEKDYAEKVIDFMKSTTTKLKHLIK
ncbi:MAG: hypothetical protein KKF56_00440 [Nanoarchaeota archaeon]|nr:hypothetical protein [Nanoarchaeota archaeon]